jgi:NADH dehydrogenase (ubiquinone) 1 beta subcomplex subunit 9
MRHASDILSSSLYRKSLKLALDWAVHRYIWRGQALYIRGLFEANKHVTEPRQQRVCTSPGTSTMPEA